MRPHREIRAAAAGVARAVRFDDPEAEREARRALARIKARRLNERAREILAAAGLDRDQE